MYLCLLTQRIGPAYYQAVTPTGEREFESHRKVADPARRAATGDASTVGLLSARFGEQIERVRTKPTRVALEATVENVRQFRRWSQ